MNGLDAFMRAPGATIEVADDPVEISRLYCESGWSDGLPIIPPTAARVEQMLAYCDRPWHEAIGKIGPRYGEATPARIAVSAVMAGAEPSSFPLIMLATILFLLFALGRPNMIVTLLVSAAGSFGCFYLFDRWLKVPLPTGFFGF